MKEFDEYLEKRGAKYFVTLTVFCYVIGTLIFNIYLYNLDISEFELLKVRYMFIGITFAVITGAIVGTGWLVYKIFRGILFDSNENKSKRAKKISKKDEKKILEKKKKIRTRRVELAIAVLVVPWTLVYAAGVFPVVPSTFGGAKPIVARLIGDPQTIRELNDLIAYETGVDVETLPFEMATEKSNLAIGANVKIIDRNKDRYFLLLTKDLYLSSTSNLAKKFLESGDIETFDDSDVEFQAKPIFFSAENIRGITSTLYSPPEITTEGDIKIAAELLARNPKNASAIQSVIEKDLPETASKIIAAVQQPKTETTDPANPSEKPAENSQPTQAEIDKIVADAVETVNPVFLNFRAKVFQVSGDLVKQERKNGRNSSSRLDLVELVRDGFQQSFPSVWIQFSGESNYLIAGQNETEFPRKIQNAFRGADSAEIVMNRLNSTEVEKVDEFTPIVAEAIVLLSKSAQDDSQYNRELVGGVLYRHFQQKARRYENFWKNPQYLTAGVDDEDYLENIRGILTAATSWENLSERLLQRQIVFADRLAAEAAEKESEPTSPETPPVEENQETPEETETPVEPEASESEPETPPTETETSADAENLDTATDEPVESENPSEEAEAPNPTTEPETSQEETPPVE